MNFNKGELTLKNLVIFGIVLLAILAVVKPSIFQGITQAQEQIGQQAEESQSPQVSTGGQEEGTKIYAISSVNLKPTITQALNETTQLISPTFYLWREDATQPTQVSISDGTGSVAVAPGESVEYAAGSDGQYYWEKKSLKVGNADTPIEVNLHEVASSTDASIQVFDTSYNELSDGAYNVTLAAGEDTNLQAKIDVTGEYLSIRNPHICVAYNDSVFQDIDISGLSEVDAPTRIISGLDQCFDTGMAYFNDDTPASTYDVSVDIVSGVDPAASNSAMDWYIIDQDLYYKDGKTYFVNPIDNSNMGATTQPSTTTYFE